MKYDPNKHHRRSTRLKAYDYTALGAYFITICTHQRECLFGEIINGSTQLNSTGSTIHACWLALPRYFQQLTLDRFVIMPNHLHGILWLGNNTGRGEAFGQSIPDNRSNLSPNASPLQPCGTQSGSIGAMIQTFKSVSTRRLNQLQGATGKTVWQRNYHDHIIRNETSLQYIRQYIDNNPLSWQQDQLHPDNPAKW
ncbi:MAG: transposase [Trichocoleus desertorum ATA4-8-CV12]|nr:transposase [Trichocoleus desertorum ATA4-8-CV12]